MTTELIDGIAEIKKIGTACIGNMAWETPYIVFKVSCDTCSLPFGEYKWHTENIYEIAYKLDRLTEKHLQEGMFFNIVMRVRGNRIWRMLKLEYR